MAKDDYHVIVYQVLAYLYTQLKAGEPVSPELLKPESEYLNINKKYWTYIMSNLQSSGYITGITIQRTWGPDVMVTNLEGAMITPLGIEYLTDNTFLKKAKEFLKDIKSIVPFV